MKISIWTILTFIGLGLHSINSEILRPKFGGQDELIGFIKLVSNPKVFATLHDQS